MLDELNIATSSAAGRGHLAGASGSGTPNRSPSKASVGHPDHRVCFGVTSVSEEQKATVGAVAAAADSADVAVASGVRTPPKDRREAMYDEFDTSVTDVSDALPDEDDDLLDPEQRARRRRSSAASATSGISDELDAPVFAGRVKPALGLLSATPTPPAEDQLAATATSSKDAVGREVEVAAATCKTGDSLADESKTAERAIPASPKRGNSPAQVASPGVN